MQIIPAILSTTEAEFERDIKKYNDSPFLKDWVHIDFMDNKFVQNKSINPIFTTSISKKFKKEAHLMVENPRDWIGELISLGYGRIIFHYESKDDPNLCIDKIKGGGLEVGIAINPQTPVKKLEPFMDKIDKVLLMGIHPGFQSREFIDETYERVKEISHIRSKYNAEFKIGVDGGVSDQNAKQLVESGVDFLVVGSFFLKGDTDANIQKIREVVDHD